MTAASIWAGQAPFQIAGLSQVNVRIPQFGGGFTLQVSQAGTSYARSNTVAIWVK